MKFKGRPSGEEQKTGFSVLTTIKRECPARYNRGRDRAPKIGTEKLYYRKDFFLKFTGTPSR
jgi:hypothetical protein